MEFFNGFWVPTCKKSIGYYTGPVNSADSTDFTGPDKTHSLVLKHATLFVFLYSFSLIN